MGIQSESQPSCSTTCVSYQQTTCCRRIQAFCKAKHAASCQLVVGFTAEHCCIRLARQTRSEAPRLMSYCILWLSSCSCSMAFSRINLSRSPFCKRCIEWSLSSLHSTAAAPCTGSALMHSDQACRFKWGRRAAQNGQSRQVVSY